MELPATVSSRAEQVAKKIRPSKSFRMKQKDPASGDGEMDEREERQERMTGLGRFDLADGESESS